MSIGKNHAKYEGQTRYWERLGMRVSYEMALEFAEKMEGAGSYFDEEVDEFTTFTHTSEEAMSEVERLFAGEDAASDTVFGGENLVIARSMEWQRKNKKRLKKEFNAEFDEEFGSELFREKILDANPALENSSALDRIVEEQRERERASFVEARLTESLDEQVFAWRRELGLPVGDGSDEDE